MTDDQNVQPDEPDEGAPDDRYPGGEKPLKGEQEDPDIEPFAGDDDILSGHLGVDG